MQWAQYKNTPNPNQKYPRPSDKKTVSPIITMLLLAASAHSPAKRKLRHKPTFNLGACYVVAGLRINVHVPFMTGQASVAA
eukprot:1158692-Pelagomonas_calceolata.AAC.1